MLGGLGNKFNYTGAEVIPCHATHITVDQSVTVIPENAFRPYTFNSIIEVICGDKVEKVGGGAFVGCTSLRRVIMPGVEIVEEAAFNNCRVLTDVECGKLERIESEAFINCTSLRSINLPSARVIEGNAFNDCAALTDAKFGSKLDRIEWAAFYDCYALERITIPLKDGMLTADDIFQECENLKQVDLVEGPIHETIAALQLEEWRNDMNEEIGSINRILSTVDAGGWNDDVGDYEDGEKAQVIRMWIGSVLRKIVYYQAEHQRLLDEEVATTLQLVLPQDIVMNNVIPFLELPSCTFE